MTLPDGVTGTLMPQNSLKLAMLMRSLYVLHHNSRAMTDFELVVAGLNAPLTVYLPFGGVHVSTGVNAELRFPRQWFQSESGLHQNWRREYDPATGRYIQADPLGLVDGTSVYGYAPQNQRRYADPRGPRPRPICDTPLNPKTETPRLDRDRMNALE